MIRLRYPFHHVRAPREVGKNEGLEHDGMVSDRFVVSDQGLAMSRTGNALFFDAPAGIYL